MEIDPSLRYTSRSTIAALVLALVAITTLALVTITDPVGDRAVSSADSRGAPATS